MIYINDGFHGTLQYVEPWQTVELYSPKVRSLVIYIPNRIWFAWSKRLYSLIIFNFNLYRAWQKVVTIIEEKFYAMLAQLLFYIWMLFLKTFLIIIFLYTWNYRADDNFRKIILFSFKAKYCCGSNSFFCESAKYDYQLKYVWYFCYILYNWVKIYDL